MTITSTTNTTGASTVDDSGDVELRWCSWHQTKHPVDEFSFKSKAAGTYQSKCRAGQREYSKAHYAANRTKRVAQVRTRALAVRSRLQEIVDAARAEAACEWCGTSDRLHARRPEGLATTSDLVKYDVADQVLNEALADPQLFWECIRCRGSQLGALQLNVAHEGRTFTLRQLILRRLERGSATAAELKQLLQTAKPEMTDQAVYVTFSTLHTVGDVERVGRGVYQLAASPRPY